MANTDLSKRDEYLQDFDRWGNEATRLANTPGVRMAGQAAFIPKEGEWRISADSSGQYLNLPR
jgi:hypothetical protein